MLTRVLAALVALAIIIPAIAFGGQLAVDLVVAVVLLIVIDEYSRMALPDFQKSGFAVLAITSGLVYGQQIWGLPAQLAPTLAICTIVILVFVLLTVQQTARATEVVTRLLGGLLYLPLLVSFVPLVRGFDSGIAWLALVLCITWAGDTGAYLAGRAFGKTKLFERISPKKTWEGAIGGVLLAVVCAVGIKYLALPAVSVGHIIAIAILGDVAGVIGDLVESMFKRSCGVKDSGWIMPGHGGLLDRIDSLLFTAPVVWLYAQTFGLG